MHDLKNMSEFSNIKSHDAEVLSISFCPKPPPKGLDGSGKIHDVDFGNSQSYTQPSLLASGDKGSSGGPALVKVDDGKKYAVAGIIVGGVKERKYIVAQEKCEWMLEFL